MKVDDIIVEQLNEARPAGALAQLGRSIGSKALKRIAPDIAANWAGRADLGATANKLYDEFSNFLGTQGKSRDQATGADIKSFFATKNVKINLNTIPLNNKIFKSVVNRAFSGSTRYGTKPSAGFMKNKFNNYLRSQGKTFDQATSKDLKSWLNSEGVRLDLNTMPAGSEIFNKVASDAMSGKIPTGAGSSPAPTGISTGSPAVGGAPSTPSRSTSGSARAPRTRARSSAGVSGSATGSPGAPSAASTPSAATGTGAPARVTLNDVRTMIKSLRKRDKITLFKELETELGLSASTTAPAAPSTPAPAPARSARKTTPSSAPSTTATPTVAPLTPAAGAPRTGAGTGASTRRKAAPGAAARVRSAPKKP